MFHMNAFAQYFISQLHGRRHMSFELFMQHALYAPGVGYYHRSASPFGTQGDFITAPELTPLFGYTMARQIVSIWSHFKNPPILFEFGAGSGRLCFDILTQLKKEGRMPAAYWILEVSASLKKVQQTTLASAFPEVQVRWLNAWPTEPFEGIVLANEVLDAMPVCRFLYERGQCFEAMVSYDQAHQTFHEHFEQITDPRFEDYLKPIVQNLPSPYLSEVNRWIEDWMSQCARMLKRGVMLIIDYGFPQSTYYHPDRSQGTLMCHTQHHSHPDPYHAPSEEDITAHVNFTHVAEAAHNSGFTVAGFTHQAAFLLSNQLLDLASDMDPCPTLTQNIQTLTHPHEMGELFKVMALTRDWDMPLQGFSLYDKRMSL